MEEKDVVKRKTKSISENDEKGNIVKSKKIVKSSIEKNNDKKTIERMTTKSSKRNTTINSKPEISKSKKQKTTGTENTENIDKDKIINHSKVKKIEKEDNIIAKRSKSKDEDLNSIFSESSKVVRKDTIRKSTENGIKKSEKNDEIKKKKTANIDEQGDKIKKSTTKSSTISKSNDGKKSTSKSTVSKKSTGKSMASKNTTNRSANEKATSKGSEPKATTKKASSKASGVKRIISEEISKASSETSSKIKVNSKAKKTESSPDGKKTSVKRTTTTKTNEIKSPNLKSTNNAINKENRQSSYEKIKGKEQPKNVIDNEEYSKKLNISHVYDELDDKFDIDKIDREFKKRKEISKEDLNNIIKRSIASLIYAIIFIVFLIFVNYGFYNFTKTAFSKDINIFAFIFLAFSIMLIEVSYKKEDTQKCISGIETLCMAIYTLALPYISQLYSFSFRKTLVISGAVIAGYYIIKSAILFFKNKNRFLRAREDFTKEQDVIDPELEDDEEYDED